MSESAATYSSSPTIATASATAPHESVDQDAEVPYGHEQQRGWGLGDLWRTFGRYFLLDQVLAESDDPQKPQKQQKTARRGVDEGSESATALESEYALLPWYVRHKRLVAFLLPLLLVHSAWWPYMIVKKLFPLFVGLVGALQRPRWMVSLTMVFGSMVAGSTSEGGAAVAFPVLTLTMGIPPPVARDFSFLIQSVGMTAAAFSIYWMGVKIENKSIIYCSIGGIGGVIFGLEKVAPTLEPAYSKMYFVCIWFAFAFSLFWQNYFYDRVVFNGISRSDWRRGELLRLPLWKTAAANSNNNSDAAAVVDSEAQEDSTPQPSHQDDEGSVDFVVNWKALLLLSFGFLGGIFTSMSGSGLDICSFALLTLFFRVSERIATPTSVLLMSGNTIVAYLYSELKLQSVSPEAYNLWLVCVPIVVIGAPLGAVMSSHFHRHVLAAMIYLTDTAQLIGALVVVQPWTRRSTATPLHLTATSAAILIAGAIAFTMMALLGQRFAVTTAEDGATTADVVYRKEVTDDDGDAVDGKGSEEKKQQQQDIAAIEDGGGEIELQSTTTAVAVGEA